MVSLAVGDRQWFKARDGVGVPEIGPASSFCRYAMLQPGVTLVRDTAQDPLFADHPLVTGGFRFYAGAPLIDDQGLALGVLSVIDTRPRPEGLDEIQLMTMDVLARQVMALLERRRALRERHRSDEAATAAVEAARLVTEKLAESDARFQAIADSMPQMVWSSRPDGHHDYYNARWYAFTGAAEGSALGDAWGEMIHPEDQERARTAWRASLSTGEPYEVEYRLLHHTGSYAWTLSRAMPIRDAAGAGHPLVRHGHGHRRDEAAGAGQGPAEPGTEPPDQEHLRRGLGPAGPVGAAVSRGQGFRQGRPDPDFGPGPGP